MAGKTQIKLKTPGRHTTSAGDDRYRAFYENANDAIAIIDLEGVVIDINRGAERLLGWSKTDLIGQHYRKVTTPASEVIVERRTQAYLAGNKPLSSTFELELIGKDGSIVPVEARTRVVRDDKGTLIGFQGIYRDLTERKRVEAALRESEAYFRALVENASDIIVILNADGSVRYGSPSVRRVLGYRLERLQKQSSFDFIHPDDLPRATETFSNLSNTPGETITIELRVLHQDGSWLMLEVTGTNLLHSPTVKGIVINARDISARRQAEEALRQSEERYRSVSESISDYAFSFINAAGDLYLEWLTDSFTTITGYRVEDLVGKPNPLRNYIHPDDLERVLTTVKGIEPGRKTTYEFRIITKNGAIRWLRRASRLSRTPLGT